MKRIYFFLPLIVLLLSLTSDDTFKVAQKKYSRVKEAYTSKEKEIKTLLEAKGITAGNLQIFIRAFKKEQELEIWGKNKTDKQYQLISSYSICASSGSLGPKRRAGDRQVPEGFYSIDRFNPQSSFHLSLGVSYPNESDMVLADKNAGGDIFIHGSCVTIGCMPMTDEKIKEIYILAVEAKNNGTKLHTHIFPCKLTEENLKKLETDYADKKSLIDFWKNLKTGYDYFEKNKSLPKVTVDSKGKYLFN
jgi:murein L,D-transpeptidase YafK